jgi:hypothetical protein
MNCNPTKIENAKNFQTRRTPEFEERERDGLIGEFSKG